MFFRYPVDADIVNMAHSAFPVISDRPVYRYYLAQPDPFNISPTAVQVFGAVIMGVVGSLISLIRMRSSNWMPALTRKDGRKQCLAWTEPMAHTSHSRKRGLPGQLSARLGMEKFLPSPKRKRCVTRVST
jgi:hypothetical protein